MEKIRVLSLFSGIGAYEKALDNLGIDYELVGFAEKDKFAIKSYCAIHNVSEDLNYGDITQIDEKNIPDVDLITYSYPCQDISTAGLKKGLFNKDGTQTRSGLFFDALRIIKEKQPAIAISENVKGLMSKKFIDQFEIIKQSLDEAGYNNYYSVLNSCDYGIPQNRERIFMVSIRKDIDKGYNFPKKQPLNKKLKDIVDKEVDEKFYLTSKQIENILKSKFTQERMRIQKDICNTIIAGNYKSPKCIQVGQMLETTSFGGNPQRGRVYSTEGLSPTITTMKGGGTIPKITKDSFKNEDITKSIETEGPIVRKITPKECWRLMGFDDNDFEKAEKVNSNTQLYKQAGNSVVVTCLEGIFKNLKYVMEEL